MSFPQSSTRALIDALNQLALQDSSEDGVSGSVMNPSAKRLEELERTISNLRFEMEIAEQNRIRDNGYLLNKIDAAKSILWMAEQYADGHAIAETGAEQRELEAAMEIING